MRAAERLSVAGFPSIWNSAIYLRVTHAECNRPWAISTGFLAVDQVRADRRRHQDSLRQEDIRASWRGTSARLVQVVDLYGTSVASVYVEPYGIGIRRALIELTPRDRAHQRVGGLPELVG